MEKLGEWSLLPLWWCWRGGVEFEFLVIFHIFYCDTWSSRSIYPVPPDSVVVLFLFFLIFQCRIDFYFIPYLKKNDVSVGRG